MKKYLLTMGHGTTKPFNHGLVEIDNRGIKLGKISSLITMIPSAKIFLDKVISIIK
jgi:hypothetical protein